VDKKKRARDEKRTLLCASEHRKPRRDGKQIKKLKLKKNVRAESDNDVGISQLKYNKPRGGKVFGSRGVVEESFLEDDDRQRSEIRLVAPLRLKESLKRNHNFRR
jgi:hypothetical protein